MQQPVARKKVIELWQNCFNEEPDFLQLYFSRVYNPRHLVARLAKEMLIAMLHTLPYTLQLWGTKWSCTYIAGVATHHNYRRQGIMQQLLTQTLQQLCDNNIPITALIPATPALQYYYNRFGYATITATQTETITPPEAMPQGYHAAALALDRKYRLYHTLNTQRQATILHTHAQFATLCADYARSGSTMHTILNAKQRPAAIAFVSQQNGATTIKELLAANNDAKQAILYDIAQHYNTTQLQLITTCQAQQAQEQPRAMLRIIQTAPFLEAWAAQNPHINIFIQIYDDIIKENNRMWHITHGKAIASPNAFEIPVPKLSVGETTQLIFNQGPIAENLNLPPITPLINLMLD